MLFKCDKEYEEYIANVFEALSRVCAEKEIDIRGIAIVGLLSNNDISMHISDEVSTGDLFIISSYAQYMGMRGLDARMETGDMHVNGFDSEEEDYICDECQECIERHQKEQDKEKADDKRKDS